MEKTKETPWTEQRLMYKNGNIDVYRHFNWETWKRMTVDERAMWTESSEATPAPISREVIDFNQKIATKAEQEVKDKIYDLGDEMLREQSKKYEDKIKHGVISDPPGETIPSTTVKVDTTEIDIMRAELKKRGIKFAYNSKLETLRKKLADADNPE